jgi:hypothetical protein
MAISKNGPMTAKQIADYIKKHNLVDSHGKTPHLSIGSRLAVDIKTRGEASRFKRSGKGVFSLNDKFKDYSLELDEDSGSVEQELKAEEELAVEGGYIGKAGEYAALAELLFRGYNASLMSVDTGVDIVAIKDNFTFNIQVKTRNISSRGDSYHFNIRIISFKRHNNNSVYYIFILRDTKKQKLNYLVLPLNELEKSIENNFVSIVGKGKLYRVTIKERNGKFYLGRAENDLTFYLNRWDIIK